MKYPKEGSFTDILVYAMNAKRIEPVERVKDIERHGRGSRNVPPMATQHSHRFEIKGGVSSADAFVKNIVNETPLLSHLKRRQG